MYTDGNGFPLTVKPSHLFGSSERMDTAEILSAIVEQACLYTPETPVGATNMKRPKAFNKEKVPNEALTDREKVSPIEAPTSVEKKVFGASSDFVRFLNEIV